MEVEERDSIRMDKEGMVFGHRGGKTRGWSLDLEINIENGRG